MSYAKLDTYYVMPKNANIVRGDIKMSSSNYSENKEKKIEEFCNKPEIKEESVKTFSFNEEKTLNEPDVFTLSEPLFKKNNIEDSSKAVPSKAVPSKAVPSKAVPSKAVPSCGCNKKKAKKIDK